MNLLDTAIIYQRVGLSVLPARRDQKRPALSGWKDYQAKLPTEAEVLAWFANAHDALCVVTGNVSGNLELLDFDNGGELFDKWAALVEAEAPGLMGRVVIEQSQSGGWHVIYRCAESVCGNIRLAQRAVAAPDEKPVALHGKTYKPRRNASGQWEIILTLIETRGEGGLFLCSPTLGYEIVQGAIDDPPILTPAERDVLLEAAWSLNELIPSPLAVPTDPIVPAVGTERPGDAYNQRGDIVALLKAHGWTLARDGENQCWRRPGKTQGWSATLRGRVFYVFSTNAAPFESDRAYGPFAVYTLLEHGGDYARAASALRALGFGDVFVASLPKNTPDVDFSALLPVTPGPSSLPSDPGLMPAELLRMPGFVGEVMDYCLATAPYPSPVMAFAGALSLLAFLAGRKVRDSGDNRTNLYLLGLAHSAAGKDWPRKINTRIIHQIGMAQCLGERFASGEGIQDALFQTQSMLFQTDEIDGMLQSINKAKDARHEAVMSTLLTMYSSASSIFPMRRKAGQESPGVIDQPSLVIFGTAIPNHYYEALSERMLTNGFFARMIILEAGPRGVGQEPRISELPPRILTTAQWWADYQPGTGNLQEFHPIPEVVEYSGEAQHLLVETRQHAEAEYSAAEGRGDPVGTTVWGRVSEQVRKLALLYAVSENHTAPHISRAAVEWASAFVMHQTRRMLFMAAGHVAENPFHAACLKALEKLRSAPGHELPHSVLLKRMKMDAKAFTVLIETLCQQGEVEAVTTSRPGSYFRAYRLVDEVKPGGEGVKPEAVHQGVEGHFEGQVSPGFTQISPPGG